MYSKSFSKTYFVVRIRSSSQIYSTMSIKDFHLPWTGTRPRRSSDVFFLQNRCDPDDDSRRFLFMCDMLALANATWLVDWMSSTCRYSLPVQKAGLQTLPGLQRLVVQLQFRVKTTTRYHNCGLLCQSPSAHCRFESSAQSRHDRGSIQNVCNLFQQPAVQQAFKYITRYFWRNSFFFSLHHWMDGVSLLSEIARVPQRSMRPYRSGRHFIQENQRNNS